MHANASGWTRVFLVGNPDCFLGALSFDPLKDRLEKTLRNWKGLPAKGQLEGVKVAWVASLSEAHASLYAARDGAKLIFFVQAADLTILGKLELDEMTICRWLQTLVRN